MRKQRQAPVAPEALDDIVDDDVLEIDNLLEIDDVADQEVDLARDDEALLAWLTSPAFAPAPPFLRNQRELHFHIALHTPHTARRRDLIKNLEQLECTVTVMEAETISGYLEYNPRAPTRTARRQRSCTRS